MSSEILLQMLGILLYFNALKFALFCSTVCLLNPNSAPSFTLHT